MSGRVGLAMCFIHRCHDEFGFGLLPFSRHGTSCLTRFEGRETELSFACLGRCGGLAWSRNVGFFSRGNEVDK